MEFIPLLRIFAVYNRLKKLVMKLGTFFSKFLSGYLWGHLLAMALVVVALCFGVMYGLDAYTHHGQALRVPKLEGMYYAKASMLLENEGLVIHVSDSGYNKKYPADVILAQTPEAGAEVKEGHVIHVTVNSASSPSLPIPDLIDNSSYREAEAKLVAMGFRMLPVKRVEGEKDWVYGIIGRGRHLATGDFVSIDTPLTLIVGNGTYDDESDIDFVSATGGAGEGDVDEFVEVDGSSQDNNPMSEVTGY